MTITQGTLTTGLAALDALATKRVGAPVLPRRRSAPATEPAMTAMRYYAVPAEPTPPADRAEGTTVEPAAETALDAAFADWDLIHTYTRAQALADGCLVDDTEQARQTGFVWPVAVTRTVWAMIEAVPVAHAHEDLAGRLHDVLWMAFLAIRRDTSGGSELLYQLILHTATAPDEVTLKLVTGPGDEGEPVVTIMLPDED